MGDKSNSDSDGEVTCELHTFPAEEECALDWSVSGISVASGYDPDRFHSEVSSSWNSPEKSTKGRTCQGSAQQGSVPAEVSRSLQHLAGSDLQKLAGSVRELQLNLAGISQMSLSPRREKKTENYLEDSDKTPKNRSISLSGVDVTPPVRDSGPGTVVKVGPTVRQQQLTNEPTSRSKFHQMKNTLKELEEARLKYNVSKIPRRSLNFTETGLIKLDHSKISQISTSSKDTESGSDQVSNQLSAHQTSKSETDGDKTVIENRTDNSDGTENKVKKSADNCQCQTFNAELIKKLNYEMQQKKFLEDQLEKLHKQLSVQEKELFELKDLDCKKEQLLLDLKTKWTEVAKNWSEQLHNSQQETARFKAENQAAKEQFFVCEEELSKALQLATDFKLKIDEEEAMKQDILSELLSERTTKANKLLLEQGRNKELTDENRRLLEKLDDLKTVQNAADKREELYQENLSNLEKSLVAEKSKHQTEVNQWQIKTQTLEDRIRTLDAEVKTTQTSMHTFYVSQMESIMSEKVATLQQNVADWEKTFNAEKLRSIEQLKDQHAEQLEQLSKEFCEKLSSQKNLCQTLESSLNAARREADALREQLELHEQRNSTLTTGPTTRNTAQPMLNFNLDSAWATLLTQQSFPRFHNNLKTSSEAVHRPDLKNVSNPKKLPAIKHVPGISTTDEEGDQRLQSRPNRSKRRPASAAQCPSMVMNNLREDKASYDQRRPMSAFPLTSNNGYDSETKFSQRKMENGSSSEDVEACDAMSLNEKKEVVTAFIRQFLEDHPESVLDASFLSSLNEMAVKLVQESFHVEEHDQTGRHSMLTMQKSIAFASSTQTQNHPRQLVRTDEL